MQTMKSFIIQATVTIVLFFSIWFLLQQVDWMSVFRVEKVTEKTEQKLGDLFWEIFRKAEKENKNQFIINSIDSLVTKICVSNNINKTRIKLHVLDKDEVNAFALPNGRLVIYSGLILAAENQEELSGVICHEIAHIELNHVMKKLIKEVGLSVLISMTTGGSGIDIIRETAKMLSSTAFDRGLEKEADIKAVDYLIKANINPESFANFLYKHSDNDSEIMKYLSWMSTHPDSKERAKYIIEYSKSRVTTTEHVLSQETWSKLKEKLKE
jgi:predicted Zn-dependent protease